MVTLASSASHSPMRTNDQGSQAPKQPSSLYSMVMTPINLTVFLVSLLLVDLRYSLARADNASGRGVWPWLPVWLRRMVLSVRGRGSTPYYHSKQKKLMKMEADEAFRLRGVVLGALGVMVVVSAVAAVCVGSRVYEGVRRVVEAVRGRWQESA